MPHFTIRFRLPEEQPELTAAMQGADAKSVLWQVDQYCRGVLKHGEPSAETRRHLEEIRETLRERPELLND
jgi:dihydroxyacetone kinase